MPLVRVGWEMWPEYDGACCRTVPLARSNGTVRQHAPSVWALPYSSLRDGGAVDDRFYKIEELLKLRTICRKKACKDRPLFIFACGGDTEDHKSRLMLDEFIRKSKLPELRDVFCVLAENVAKENEFKSVDLLTQEAMIADISDCIILFCESAGSICELGAFSSLPSVKSILVLGIDKSRQHDQSFINHGPVKMVNEASDDSSVSRVFYLDLEMPLGSPEFIAYLRNIRNLINEKNNSGRKRPNSLDKGRKSSVNVGPLALELIDLVVAFAPITLGDLKSVYCKIKGYDESSLKIKSPTIEDSMKIKTQITFESVIAFMRSTNMIRRIQSDEMNCGNDIYVPSIKPVEPFLFTKAPGLEQIKAKVLLRKRSHGIKGAADVYSRFD